MSRIKSLIANVGGAGTSRNILLVAACSFLATFGGIWFFASLAQTQGVELLTLMGDSKGYQVLGVNLAERGVFSMEKSEPFAPESFRSPGYPFFLAVLYGVTGNYFVVLLLQALIVSIAPLLLYLLFRTYDECAAFLAALIFAFEPVRLFLSSSLLTDALFCTVLLLVLYLMTQHTKGTRPLLAVAAAGTLLGIDILIRPVAMFLPLLLPLYFFLTMSKATAVKYSAVFVVFCGLITMPWIARNYVLFGAPSISSVGAANLMLYNAPEYLAFAPSERGQTILTQFRQEQDALPRSDALSLARSSAFTANFREIIRGEEVRYLFFHVFKTIPFFVSDGLRDVFRLFTIDIGTMPNLSSYLLQGQIVRVFEYAFSGGFGVFLFLAGVSFWSLVTLCFFIACGIWLYRRDYALLLITGVLVFYFALLTGPVSSARYRLPVEGLMLFGALTTLVCGWRLVVRNKKYV